MGQYNQVRAKGANLLDWGWNPKVNTKKGKLWWCTVHVSWTVYSELIHSHAVHVLLFTCYVNSNRVVSRWWGEAYLLLSSGRGGWGDYSCGSGVENGGLWWPRGALEGSLGCLAPAVSATTTDVLPTLEKKNCAFQGSCWRREKPSMSREKSLVLARSCC